MTVKATRGFPYSLDGVNVKHAKPGDTITGLSEKVREGLITGGFVTVEKGTASGGDPFADLSIDQIKILLDAKGVKYHHKAGIDKLRQLLQENS